MAGSVPLMVKIIPSCKGINRNTTHRVYILVFTFLCYMSYHLSRKPISIVKSVLHRKNCSIPLVTGGTVHPELANSTACDWAPFNHGDFAALLGSLDLAYLFAYAVGMFFSGHLAERMNLRHFLALGMISSGVMTAAFGFGYFFSIHHLWFYIVVQVIGGLCQSSGWPSVVTCVGNWYGKGKRGFIMGVWNSHTSVGNILGSLIAGVWVNNAWGWSFVVPGIIIGSLGVMVFLTLVPEPSMVGCKAPDHQLPGEKTDDDEVHGDSINTETDVGVIPASEPGLISTTNSTANLIGNGDVSQFSVDNEDIGVINIAVCKEEVSFKIGSPASNGKIIETPLEGVEFAFEGGANLYKNGEETLHNEKSTGAILLANGMQQEVGKLPLTQHGKVLVKKNEESQLIKRNNPEKAISFVRALLIPGVIEFSLCLFFAKLVSYTFLFWLPKYISAKTSYDAEVAGDLSTLFDVGGIAGGIVAGLISDYTGARASTCVLMLILAAPTMYIYNVFGSINYAHNVGLLIVCGFMVNGPYALITTAVSADLGTHKSLQGNAKALATVTAIIDGTGSIGAALGPLLTGVISRSGWNNVFYMLISADIIAMVFLIRLVVKEIQASKFCVNSAQGDVEVTVQS